MGQLGVSQAVTGTPMPRPRPNPVGGKGLIQVFSLGFGVPPGVLSFQMGDSLFFQRSDNPLGGGMIRWWNGPTETALKVEVNPVTELHYVRSLRELSDQRLRMNAGDRRIRWDRIPLEPPASPQGVRPGGNCGGAGRQAPPALTSGALVVSVGVA
jgi:hypothetical protein